MDGAPHPRLLPLLQPQITTTAAAVVVVGDGAEAVGLLIGEDPAERAAAVTVVDEVADGTEARGVKSRDGDQDWLMDRRQKRGDHLT